MIKNLIFDLGGVIINLDLDKTYKRFADLSRQGIEDIRKNIRESAFFTEYEEGLISDDQFRDLVRASLRVDLPSQQLDDAWNAMLLDIPPHRLRLLEKLRTNYSVFLLSNTNNIHLQRFTTIAKGSGGKELDSYFDRTYYSHVIKMKKPDAQIYTHVLNENKLHAAETLFFDDNLSNIKGAQAIGIETFHVQHPDEILNYFNEPKP